MTTTVDTIDGLHALVGQRLGHSQWLEITQERVDAFADAVTDHQWIHVDPQRAHAGRFGGPVAHGQLVLSLTSHLLGQILDLPGFAMTVHYGWERVRFLAPVPVGSRLRAEATLRAVTEFSGGAQLAITLVFAVAGRRAPVCSARVLLRAYR